MGRMLFNGYTELCKEVKCEACKPRMLQNFSYTSYQQFYCPISAMLHKCYSRGRGKDVWGGGDLTLLLFYRNVP
jgi:hypothetical protein